MDKKIKKYLKKDIIINDIIEDLYNAIYENKSYIQSLLREALRTRTIKELKEINCSS